MSNLIARYAEWLHLKWPSGTVEKLPEAREDGSTNVKGVYVVGDLTGIPLLKLSADSGARAIRTIVADSGFAGEASNGKDDALDVAVVGGGVAGMAAALEAKKLGLSFRVFEASSAFSTIKNFPVGKPIFTYPTDMTPAGELQFTERSAVKEGLVEELVEQIKAAGIESVPAHVEHVRRVPGGLEVVIDGQEPVRARRVVLAIGRSGNYRRLGVPGEERDEKVSNRLHDPKDFCGRDILVVGGGDSALETASALAACGSRVTVSYRKPEFSRPKPENVERLADPGAGSITLEMASAVKEIGASEVVLKTADGEDRRLANDYVFTMIGREAPLDFFRRSGIRIRGEWTRKSIAGLVGFFALIFFVYHWKSNTGLGFQSAWEAKGWFPANLPKEYDKSRLLGTIGTSMGSPAFWYTFVYTSLITIFGIRRIRRRKTPYVKLQTLSLTLIQAIPLFILPMIVLPWLGHNGVFDGGVLKSVADGLFPVTEWDPHGREYWRSVGFILAWPLLPWNFFTGQPMTAWLIIGLIQTFVLIPWIVIKWGKGAYCGWICSCGALAETMGDEHRQKMPHGPKANRWNMIGQVFLALAAILFVLRVVTWAMPDGRFKEIAESVYMLGLYGKDRNWGALPFPLNITNYAWFVDLLWAGVFGVAFYFWFSGRVWCRFACPLSALMHIYARFSRFRIIPEKKKCISCNVCTSVCHQGIDVMSFANKGQPMEDPQCVRCSACVAGCPTGVLQFGEVDRKTGEVIRVDSLSASNVRSDES